MDSHLRVLRRQALDGEALSKRDENIGIAAVSGSSDSKQTHWTLRSNSRQEGQTANAAKQTGKVVGARQERKCSAYCSAERYWEKDEETIGWTEIKWKSIAFLNESVEIVASLFVGRLSFPLIIKPTNNWRPGSVLDVVHRCCESQEQKGAINVRVILRLVVVASWGNGGEWVEEIIVLHLLITSHSIWSCVMSVIYIYIVNLDLLCQ